MMKYTMQLGLVALLAASAACSSNSNPMSPSATPGAGNVAAVPEGTPTLKANTPGSPSPASGATTELGPQNTLPVTLSVSNAVATHANTLALSHRFQLFEGSTLLAEPIVPAGGGGRTSWTVTTQLKFDTTYTWRVRAELADAYTRVVAQLDVHDAGGARVRCKPYAGSASRVALAAARSLARGACRVRRAPGPGASLVPGTWRHWEFMDYLVDELRKEDNRWGYNGKRGNANDPSQDIVDYHWGAGAEREQHGRSTSSTSCSGTAASPSPAWIDQTGVTASQGTIGRWTGRGRFTN